MASDATIDGEPTDDRLVKLLDQAGTVLSRCVVPLYRNDDGRPSQFGTGFFVRARSSTFLVSAAHVLEEGASLYYYIEPNVTAKLSGERRLNRWNGDRENDPVDVGVLKLDQSAPPYSAVDKCALDISYLRPKLLPRAGKTYSIIGFPATQSKVNPIAKELRSTVFSFRNRSIPDDEYSTVGCSPESHIVLSVDLREGVDSEGQQRNFPKPQGMSGSPIFMLLDEKPEVDIRSFPIVGIGTKYIHSHKALIGTDVAIAVAMINDERPGR